MKIRKIATDLFDLFDPEQEKKRKQEIYNIVFKDQDEMAEKSEVFNRILQSEISDDPETRYAQTNSPKSKTRNALITRHIFPTQKEWEEDLLKVYFSTENSITQPFMRSMPYNKGK